MKPSGTFNIRAIADGLGIFGAAACAIHCIAVPVMLILGATTSTVLFGGESFHLMMLGLVVPSAIIAFWMGCSRHKDRWVLILGAVGTIGLVLAGTLLHDIVGETGEKVATVASAIVLITAHIRNFRLCRSEPCDT